MAAGAPRHYGAGVMYVFSEPLRLMASPRAKSGTVVPCLNTGKCRTRTNTGQRFVNTYKRHCMKRYCVRGCSCLYSGFSQLQDDQHGLFTRAQNCRSYCRRPGRVVPLQTPKSTARIKDRQIPICEAE